jgi:hypothetical protein
MADTDNTDRPTFTPEDLAVLGNDAADDKPTVTAEAAEDLDFDPITDAALDAGDKDAGDKDDSGGDVDAGKGAAKESSKTAASKTAAGTALDVDADDKGEEGEADDAAGATKDDADPNAAAKDDKGKQDKKGADWRKPHADRQIARVAEALKGKVLAKDYDKELKKRTDAINSRLSRYKSEQDYMDARWALEERVSAGEFKATKLPENATPAEVTAWRKDNGIPEKAEAYDIPKVAGHQWTEADKPVVDKFKAVFHKANVPQSAVNDIMTAYAMELQEAMTAREEAFATLDKEDRVHVEETLRADPDIGNAEYRPTITLINRMLKDAESFPELANGLGDKLAQARDADGHRLINDPAMLKLLRKMAMDAYGEGAMPSSDVSTARSSRKAEIEKQMNTDMNEYYRQGMDKEYMEIIEAEQAGSGRRGKRAA